MTATFQSLQEVREPKALKAVNLLGNLVQYPHNEDEAKAMLNRLADEVDKVDYRFAKKWGWSDDPIPELEVQPAVRTSEWQIGWKDAPSSSIAPGTADGGASFESEVRWALDALKRGDTKLAQNRLTRILKGVP